MVDSLVSDRQVADPLSTITRAERRALLLMNVVIAAMVYGGLIPSEIQALGLKTAQVNQDVLFGIAYLMGVYFFVAFGLYAAADLKAWRTEVFDLQNQHMQRVVEIVKRGGRNRVKQTIRDMVPGIAEGDLDRATTKALDALTDEESDSPVRQAFPKFWERYSRPYRSRMVFEVYFPLVASGLNLTLALVWRAA